MGPVVRSRTFRTIVEDLYNLRAVARASASTNRAWQALSGALPGADARAQRLLPFPGDFPDTGFPEALAATRVLLSRRLNTSKGRHVRAFEQEMAAHLGARHAVACTSGTAALGLALAALGIGPGDEVIVPAITYAATALAPLHVGATPVFADVSLPDGTLDPAGVAAVLTPRTRAVVAVHLSGVPAPLAALQALCDRHGVALVEDVAQAVGGTLGGRALGTFGRLGCFSFNAGKNVTTGEGGLVVTDDAELARRLRIAVNAGAALPDGTPVYGTPLSGTAVYGMTSGATPHAFVSLGWNHKMSELAGAVGRVQARRLPAIAARRAANGRYLADTLADVPGIALPALPADATPAWWRFPVRVLAADRDAVVAALRRHRVTCYAPDYTVLPDNPVFGGRGGALPGARAWHAQTLLLPTHPGLGVAELRDVAPALRRVLA